MGSNKRKAKNKSFGDQLQEMFTRTKSKADNPNRDEGKSPSLAEKINWGGQGESMKQKRLKGKRK